MNRCFVIAGPESSGNRLLADILVRAGCQGQGSTNQYKTVDELPAGDVVWIKHRISGVLEALKARGQVVILIIVRDWFATVASMVDRGHRPTPQEAKNGILETIRENTDAALRHGVEALVIPYESLSPQSIELLLRTYGLDTSTISQPLTLHGQEYDYQTYFPNPIETNDRRHKKLLQELRP